MIAIKSGWQRLATWVRRNILLRSIYSCVTKFCTQGRNPWLSGTIPMFDVHWALGASRK